MSGQFLHTMLRVRDLERTVGFYRDELGMSELRRNEVTEGRYTLVFMGYPPTDRQNEIELTYNWDQKDNYELGTAFGHLAFGVQDVRGTVEGMRAHGVNITREPGPVKFGSTVIAFVEDPDGYKIELIERKS